MTLITNEVYDYMLDEIQANAVAGEEKMKTIIEHLKLQPTKAANYASVAEEVQTLLRRAAVKIDELPALGADLEALAGHKVTGGKKGGLVQTVSNDAAVEAVGPKMTAGAMEKALLDFYGAERVEHNVADNTFTIYRGDV